MPTNSIEINSDISDLQASPEQLRAMSVFLETGIELEWLTQDIVQTVREKSMNTVSKNIVWEDALPCADLFQNQSSMSIVESKEVNFGTHMQITNSEGRNFICKQGDIRKDNTVDLLDLFVLKEDQGNFPKGSIVESIADDDSKVRIDDSSLHWKVYKSSYWYADRISIQWQEPGHCHVVPSFTICRIRDLYIWEVPEYRVTL